MSAQAPAALEGASRPRELLRLAKAQLSALLATALDWSVLQGLITVGLDYRAAIAAGALVGALADFTLKQRFVFVTGGRWLNRGQLLRYSVVSVLSGALNVGLAWALVALAGIPARIAAVAAAVVLGLVWNYPLHKSFVFGGRQG